MSDDLAELHRALEQHQPADAEERADRDQILAFAKHHAQPFDRGIAEGHLTGSALVVSDDGRQVLLLRHKKLQRWLQPGGHADPHERRGETVALREALEETGLAGLALHPSAPRPLDVDVHEIPARPGEPAHEHLDLRYLVTAPREAGTERNVEETDDLRWFAWDELPADLDSGLRRALGKARTYWPAQED